MPPPLPLSIVDSPHILHCYSSFTDDHLQSSSLFVCRSCLGHLRTSTRLLPSSTLAPFNTEPAPKKITFRDVPTPRPFPRVDNDALLPVPPEELLSLQQYVLNDDPLAAYEKLSSITQQNDMATHDEQVKKVLLKPSRWLLQQIIEGKDKDKLPSLEVYMEELQQSGILRSQHYGELLWSMMQRCALESEVLPVYKMAIELLQRTTVPERTSLPGRPSSILTNDVPGAVIYLAFFYLKIAKAESDVLDRAQADPGLQQSPRVYHLKEAMSALPGDMVSQLETAIRLGELRRLLSQPKVLRETLSKFTARNDPASVRRLYNEARNLEPRPMKEQAYAAFIHALLSSWRTQDTALEIFDNMQEDGVEPGHSAWEALLHYGIGRPDPDITLKIWKQMIESGIVPDIYCWTTRISTQIKHGQYDAAVASLREMTDSGTIPTTATINAALTGLLGAEQDELINKVMAIAEEYKVPVDEVTYNTVLKNTLKHEGYRAGLEVLKSMEANGVSPTIYTFSILLDGFSKTSVDQAFEVLQAMEEYGIEPNVQTYTSLISGLVQRNNLEAIDVVLNHMLEREVVPNSRTYTILIKAALTNGDIERIDSLWKEIDRNNIWRDHVLWTETIIGYAQLGEVKKSMDLIRETKNPKWRVVISLKAYTIILRALHRRNALQEARQIAEDLVSEWYERGEVTLWNSGKVETDLWDILDDIGGPRWTDMLRQRAVEALKSGNSV